ncbi:hypothetical protein IFM89_017633 [Coptis chinensis]|uniref:Uncharacterized protein n=1 Tax=Coptis chinensis TaxID=261450 RepID=A0A835LEK3_9MAGN|nr:hypothetical protein IFM89_017633 [Coptis chinensis]
MVTENSSEGLQAAAITTLPYKVEVLETCQISPPLGSVSSTSLPLSFFDLTPWYTLFPIRAVYYFEVHHPKTYLINTIVPNIKHSLSLTLQYFFPLAGYISWPDDSTKPHILYKDGDSVPLTVAECNYDFDHLSGKHLRNNANELYPLIATFEEHALSNPKLIPLLNLQITLFPDSGICIGITYNHMAMDGRSANHFMKTWASLCRSQGDTSLVTESLPFHDRTMVKDRNGIELVYLKDLETMGMTKETCNILKIPDVPIDKAQGTFVISCSEIEKLRQWVSTRIQKDNQTIPAFHLSTFILISAYVWICSIKARRTTEDVLSLRKDPNEYFCFPIDCRARLDPPLPVTYFGNAVGTLVVNSDMNELIEENGMAIAAELIGKAIMNIDTEIWSTMAEGVSYCHSFPGEQLTYVSSSPKFAKNETDFGWGNKVKKIQTAGGSICLYDGPNEKGSVEIDLVRDAFEMNAFAALFTSSIENLRM